MKNVYLALLTSVGIAAGLLSCSQDKLEPTANVASKEADVAVVNGRLRFSDGKVLRSTLASLNDETASAKWEQQFAGFNSMRTVYNELVAYDVFKAMEDGSIKKYDRVLKVVTEQDGQKSYERAVASSAFATVLDANGLVQVGDTLYRVDDVVTVAVPLQYESEIYNAKPTHGVVRPVVHKIGGVQKSAGARALSIFYPLEREYSPQGLVFRRFKGEGYSYNRWVSGQYWEAGYKVWHQRNNWRGWGAENADQIQINVSVRRNGQCQFINTIAGPRYSCGMVGDAAVSEVDVRYSEPWTGAYLGTVTVDFSYYLRGNGTQDGTNKFTLSDSGSWQETW